MTGDRNKDDAQVLESPPHVPAPLPPASEWLKAGPEYMVSLKCFKIPGGSCLVAGWMHQPFFRIEVITY